MKNNNIIRHLNNHPKRHAKRVNRPGIRRPQLSVNQLTIKNKPRNFSTTTLVRVRVRGCQAKLRFNRRFLQRRRQDLTAKRRRHSSRRVHLKRQGFSLAEATMRRLSPQTGRNFRVHGTICVGVCSLCPNPRTRNGLDNLNTRRTTTRGCRRPQQGPQGPPRRGTPSTLLAL